MRVTANHLRERLAEYYQSEGRNDKVLIELPRGTYVPVFRMVANRRLKNRGGRRSRRVFAVAGAVAVLVSVGLMVFAGADQTDPTLLLPERERLTYDPGYSGSPTISPDGKLLAYSSDRAPEGSLDIWILPMQKPRIPVRLTRHPAVDSFPEFSPDGSRIVFRSDRDGGGIYVAPVIGGESQDASRRAGGGRVSLRTAGG